MTPREITLAAYNYLMGVIPPTQKISDIRVEEITSKGEGGKKLWNVILSYDATGEFVFEKKREYKEFKIDDTGKVISMTIKKIEKL